MAVKQVITFSLGMAALAAIFSSASASTRFDAVYVNPTTGSDTNNCRVTPATAPPPKPCKTITHAGTLLTGPGSVIFLETGTYNEMAVVMVDIQRFPSVGAALAIGKAPNATVEFNGGGFMLHGDGWLAGPRGIKMINCLADCITASGISASQPLHGGIENEDIYGAPSGHIIAMANTVNFELGYNFFSDAALTHLVVYNSPGFNIHETSTLMTATKMPQIGGYVVNSPNGLFDTHVDTWAGPTALSAVNSPGLHDPIVDTPRKGNVCPASDVATDMFSSSWTAITSIGCITQ